MKNVIHSTFSDELLTEDSVLPETHVLEEMGIFDYENLNEFSHDATGGHFNESWDSHR